MLRARFLCLNISLVLFLTLSALSQTVRTPNQSPEDSATAPSAQKPAAPQADADSADIPPFARDRISEEQYFALRDAQVRMRRGIDDLVRNPQLRSQAVRTMQLQESFVRYLQSRMAAFAPLAAPVPSWTPLGPAPIPNGQTSPSVAVSGRVTAIAIHPTDPNTVFVGTAQGGLYRSQDGGGSWTALMDSAQSLAIGAIALDPTDPNNVFVGTGEGNFSADSFFGVGLYIITGATTATPVLTGPFNTNGVTDVFTGRSISNILVNPADHNNILIATSSGFSGLSADTFSTLPARGVFVSVNALSGAATFTQLAQPWTTNRAITDMVMDPGDANHVLINVFGAAVTNDGGVWETANAWAAAPTWTQRITKQAIAKFAVNRPATVTTFLATFDETPATCTAGHNGTAFTSLDGTTWTQLTAANGFCGGQCFYDMAPAFDPTDSNIIFLGGSSIAIGACPSHVLLKSTNGGSTFVAETQAEEATLHADSHVTAIAPSNHLVVYAGNDGGIFRSIDGGATWASRNTAGFNATQFESMSVHPTDPNFSIGGTQDNGTEWLKPDGTWTRADFGDGGYSAIDQNAVDTTTVTMYHTYFNATNAQIAFARVTSTASASDGGWLVLGCGGAANGINCADATQFYAPLALGPGTPNTLYFGTDHLYRSPDQGTTMTAVSQAPLACCDLATGANFKVSAIGIAPQDDNVRLVGMTNGKVFATTTGATTLTDITGPIPAKFIARAAIDPTNKDVAYVTLDGYGIASHAWKTTNLSGAPPTWTATSSGLPDVPVNAFAIDSQNPSYLYAGTDIGVFMSADAGANWAPYGTGLPRVAVFDLNIQKTAHKVRIGTHGRGAWEIAASTFANTTGLAASSTAPLVGANVTFTATVDKGTGVPFPTGTVTFSDGAAVLGTGALNASAVATFQTAALAAGAHNITASYGGDTLYAASTSVTVVVTVGNPGNAPTTTALTASATTPALGVNVTFSAAVNKGTGTATPTGTITFSDGATALGSVTLDATGSASLQTSALASGVHNITAAYSGDTTYAASTSTAAVVTVVTPTTTSLASSSASPVVGTAITLTATIAKAAGTATPTGSVTFFDGATVLGTGTLNASAVATLQTASLALGAHSITAVYGGDTLYIPSTSSSVVVTVVAPAPDFTVINVTQDPNIVAAGNPAGFLIQITPQNGFSSTVSFTCSGAPPASSCSFNPPSVTPNGAPASTTLTILTTARSVAAVQPAPGLGTTVLAGSGILAFVLMAGFSDKKRRWQAVSMVLVLIAIGAGIVACGGGGGKPQTFTGTPAGTYTVTVTATSGAITHSSTLTLVVQ